MKTNPKLINDLNWYNCLPAVINPCILYDHLFESGNQLHSLLHRPLIIPMVQLASNLFHWLITSFVSTWSLMEKLLKLRKYNLTARNIWPYFAVYYNFAKWRIHQLGQVKRSWMVSLIFTTRLSSLFYSWIRAHFAQFSQGGVPFLTDFESFIEQKNITKDNG